MTWSNRVLKTVSVGHWRTVLIVSVLVTLAACATTEPVPEQPATDEQAQAQADAFVRSQFTDAIALKKAGDVAQAEAHFLDLSQAHPELTGPLANLGIIAMERGDREQAQDYFNQVIALDPMHLHALNGLGVLARERGVFSEAEGYYRQALDADADFAPALKNLAILLELYQGRLEEALALVERYQALQDEPDPQLEGWVFDLKNRIN